MLRDRGKLGSCRIPNIVHQAKMSFTDAIRTFAHRATTQ